MYRLPIIFLISTFSLFGILWIIFEIDPETAAVWIFALFVFLLFVTVFGFLGLIIYFLRTRLYKRYDINWYIFTSFKMAFFAAVFIAIAATLAIFDLVSLFNVSLAILSIALFAIYSYLGKKIRKK